MPLFNIKDYAMAGLNSDLIPSDVGSNYLTDGKNIRAVSGGISPSGGYTPLFNLPKDKEPQDLYFVDSGTGGQYWIIMCADAIYLSSGTMSDVSPTKMNKVEDITKWSATDLSGVPVINHPANGPMYMTDHMDYFEPLPFKSGQTWVEAGHLCNLIISHKQFLFALGVSDNGTYIPDSVRWSSVADIGGIPQTWDELDTTNVAGYTQLGGTGGEIIGALPMRDSLVVYRRSGISVIDYIGGQYIWRVRHLNSSIGLLAPDAVVDVRGTHYFISDGDVYQTDGNSISSIATKRVRKNFRAINKATYKLSYAVHNAASSEIFFVIPSAGSTYPDKAFIYNYEYDSWYVRDMPVNTRAKYGATMTRSNHWDGLDTTWDGFNNSWDSDTTTPFDNAVVGLMPIDGDQPGKIITLSGIIGSNAEPFDSIIERTDLILETLDQATMIQRIYPHIQSANSVYVQVGSQQVPGGVVTWKPPIEFNPNTQRKIDIRTTGILHAYRIIMKDVKNDFTVSGVDFLFVEAGKR